MNVVFKIHIFGYDFLSRKYLSSTESLHDCRNSWRCNFRCVTCAIHTLMRYYPFLFETGVLDHISVLHCVWYVNTKLSNTLQLWTKWIMTAMMAMREKEMATQESVSNYQHREIIRSLLTQQQQQEYMFSSVWQIQCYLRRSEILWEFAINEVNNVYCSFFAQPGQYCL